MIAYCGITCTECPAYLASREDDDEKMAAVAKEWSEQFKSDIAPADINCDGCQSPGGRIFNFCRLCEIRKCGREREMENCGHCAEYPCRKVSFVLEAVPGARETLERVREAR
jgi:hypothetical protein